MQVKKALLLVTALGLMMFTSAAEIYDRAYKKALRLWKNKWEDSNRYFRP